MDAVGGKRADDERGAPRLLQHCAAFERISRTADRSARTRLETVLGGEFANMLCRALTRGPRAPAFLLVL